MRQCGNIYKVLHKAAKGKGVLIDLACIISMMTLRFIHVIFILDAQSRPFYTEWVFGSPV